MKHFLLNHQPQKGLQAACAQQGQAPTCNARGKGHTSASPKTLTRILLVLLTMLLLPSAAWGQEYISSTFSGINLGQGEGSGPIYYNSATATTSTTDASTPRIEQGSTATGWDVKGMNSSPESLAAEQGSNKFYFRPNNTGQETIVKFNLESQFGINGKFVKAEIIYSYSYIKSIKADATKIVDASNIALANSDISFTCSESGTAEGTTGTITANVSDYSNMVFANNKIDLSFTVTTAAVQSGIPSFTISEIRLYFEDVTEQPFNIWVNGTSLTGQNITTFLDGKLGYTQPDGNKPAILHLKGTTAIQSIYTTLENLEIHLSGENKITPSSQVANGICSSQSRDEGTLTFTTEEGGSLTIATGVSVIRGFGKCTGNLETHQPYNITNYRTNGVYYYLSTNSEGTDTTTIKWLKITEAQTYPLWIAGTQVTESNKGNVLGDSKVSFTPADNTTTPATPATLTLDNATLTVSTDGGAAIESSLDNLIVYLVGDNTVQAQAGSQNITSFYAFKGNSNNTITFQTNVQEPGKIQGLVLEESVFNAVTPAYQEGLGLTRNGDNFTIGAIEYGLSIGETAVTSLNASDVFGNGTVSFKTATVGADQTSIPATLTLNGATNLGSIYTTLQDMTIHLKGENTISVSQNGNDKPNGIISEAESSGTLTFTMEEGASLEISSAGSAIRGFQFPSGFEFETHVPCELTNTGAGYYYLKNKLYTSDTDTTSVTWAKISEATVYPIWVNGNQITSSYAGGDGVSYDDANKKLTLTDATIDCTESGFNPIVSTIKDLKVHLVKSNTFKILHNYEAFKYVGEENDDATLTFSTVDPSDYQDLGSFKIDFENNYVHNPVESNISSGYSIKVTEGETSTEIPSDFNWNWDSNQDTSVSGWMGHKYNSAGAYIKLFYLQVYDLWLSTTRFYYPNGLSPASGITFDPDPSTPTLTYNYGDNGYHVYSGLSELTLKVGCNNESNQAEYRMQAVSFGKPNDITATIAEKGNLILAKDNSEGEFRFLGDGTNPVISGFDDVTYDDFIILSDGAKYDTEKKQLVDASGTAMTAATFATSVDLAQPFFESSQNEDAVTISMFNSNDYGTLKYSIDYVDGSTGVTDATYDSENQPTMSKPGTLTAYVYLNGETSETSTGKYFGAKQEVFTVAIGDKIEGTSWFTPEIKADDQIESKFMTQEEEEEDESGIFEREGEGSELYLVAKKSGTTTVNASLWCEEGLTVLNSNIALTFNVGESLSSVFEGENTYGAIYSETAIQVPEGMTAFVITGIDEETGSVKTSDPLDFIPAKTAVLLEKGTDAIAITHVPYTGTATAPTNNKLNYSDPNSPAKPSTTDNWYVIYNNKFVKVTAGTEVRGGKCYLNLNGTPAGTRGFYNIGNGEGTTAIREVKNGEVNSEKWGNGEWFDLQGRRLYTKPNKSGLYIHNGKKIVIK